MIEHADDILTLVTPALCWEQEYQAMVREFLATDEIHFNNFPLALENFAAFVAELEDEAAGRNLPPGIFPQQTYWTIRNGISMLGEIRLRPTKPDDHIGYNIRPSERRKGYATRQLALGLEEAQRHGLAKVMLPVRQGNTGSERTIEKLGGYIDGAVCGADGTILRHYWIDLL